MIQKNIAIVVVGMLMVLCHATITDGPYITANDLQWIKNEIKAIDSTMVITNDYTAFHYTQLDTTIQKLQEAEKNNMSIKDMQVQAHAALYSIFDEIQGFKTTTHQKKQHFFDSLLQNMRKLMEKKIVLPILFFQTFHEKKTYEPKKDFTCPKGLPYYWISKIDAGIKGCIDVEATDRAKIYEKVTAIDDKLFYILSGITTGFNEEALKKTKQKVEYLKVILQYGTQDPETMYLGVPILNFDVKDAISNLKNEPIQINGSVKLISIEINTHDHSMSTWSEKNTHDTSTSTWFGKHWGKCVVALFLAGALYWHCLVKKAKQNEVTNNDRHDEIKQNGKIEKVVSEI